MCQLNCVIKSNWKAIEAKTFVAGNELKIYVQKFCKLAVNIADTSYAPVCILYRYYIYTIPLLYLSYICHFNRAFCQHLFAAQTKEKEEFTCPSHIANGNYADPATCRRFYQVNSIPSPSPSLFYSIAQSNWANCCEAKVKHFEPTLSVEQSRTRSFGPTAILTVPASLSLTHSLSLFLSPFMWQCVDGYPYLNRCPSGLYFDDLQKFCTFKDEAKCGPLPTSKWWSYVWAARTAINKKT